MTQFEDILSGGDLRSLGANRSAIAKVNNQSSFDELFKCLFHESRLVVMRAADAIEKITINNSQYLASHKKELFTLCSRVELKELKWHLALLIPRLHLSRNELGRAWDMLVTWAKDKANSRIVRVNSIQGLFEMVKHQSELQKDFALTLSQLEKENIPSLNARIRKLRNSSYY